MGTEPPHNKLIPANPSDHVGGPSRRSEHVGDRFNRIISSIVPQRTLIFLSSSRSRNSIVSTSSPWIRAPVRGRRRALRELPPIEEPGQGIPSAA